MNAIIKINGQDHPCEIDQDDMRYYVATTKYDNMTFISKCCNFDIDAEELNDKIAKNNIAEGALDNLRRKIENYQGQCEDAATALQKLQRWNTGQTTIGV